MLVETTVFGGVPGHGPAGIGEESKAHPSPGWNASIQEGVFDFLLTLQEKGPVSRA